MSTTAAPPLARLLDAAEVADMLDVSKDRVWALSREGKLPAVKLGRRTHRWRPDTVAAAIEELER